MVKLLFWVLMIGGAYLYFNRRRAVEAPTHEPPGPEHAPTTIDVEAEVIDVPKPRA